MSFCRIDLLPSHDSEEAQASRERWRTEEGRNAFEEIVIPKIRDGAGKDFLNYEFFGGDLPFLKNDCDLAGIEISGENITFPDFDNFKYTDFSYAKFWHCTFENVSFFSGHFYFARFYNVKFRDSIFSLSHFYGCQFEKCCFESCDFVDENGFFNCDIAQTVFVNCFYSKNKFMYCRFDENVSFRVENKPILLGLLAQPNRMRNETLDLSQISGIYRGIKDGFAVGEIHRQARRYAFLQNKAYTRYNQSFQLAAYLWELCAGYGFKPWRVLLAAGALFIAIFLWFLCRLGSISDSLLISAGAFLTFGAKVELLSGLTLFDQAIYIFAAFSGVSSVALFITVLASVLLKEN